MTFIEFVAKYKTPLAAAAGIAALVGAFLLGRYTGPTKTLTKIEIQVVEKEVVRTEIQYVDRIVTVKDTARDVHREIKTVKQPDGTVTTTVVIDDKTKVNESSQRDTKMAASTQVEVERSTTKTSEKLVVAARPDWHLGLQLGAGLALPTTPQLAAGLSIERRIVGPFWLGAWGQLQLGMTPVVPKSFTAGVSVGLEF